jgi:hypothetical protein
MFADPGIGRYEMLHSVREILGDILIPYVMLGVFTVLGLWSCLGVKEGYIIV